MPTGGIPPEVREFIFAHLDAVEHLEVLLFLRQHAGEEWDADKLAREIRTNPESVAGRLVSLERSRLVVRRDQTPLPLYKYEPATSDLVRTVDLLMQACKIRRHQVYELIFSPMKQARSLADAFWFKG